MNGKSIKLFLVEGSANGLMTAEIGQWTGKALLVPRGRVEVLGKRAEASKAGVYLLVGLDPDLDSREMVYVGEAEDVYDRLKQHVKTKDFWNRVCLFTASDENLTKAHVKYLESRLVEMGIAASRATMDNGNTPPRPKLPESEISDMERYLEEMATLLPVLGITFLQPSAAVQVKEKKADQSPVFVINSVGASARAREVGDEFVVFKGSSARAEGVPSWQAGRVTRDRLLKEGLLQAGPAPGYFQFATDIPFNSPSIAAAVVLARNVNGRTEWKTEGTGETYAEWQDAKLNLSDVDHS